MGDDAFRTVDTATLTFDLGTGGVRACLVSPDGEVLGRHAVRWAPGADEALGARSFDPRVVRRAVEESARSVLASAPDIEVTGITAASMRPACAFVDEAGHPVYAGPNSDARGVGHALDLVREHADVIHRITGQLPPLLAWPARLLWFRHNDPDALDRVRMVVGLEGWVLMLLGGPPSMDPSAASATGLFDLREGRWSSELCSLAGWDAGRLPEVTRPRTEVGNAQGDLASTLGLEGVPLLAGTADTQAAAFGVGATEPGSTAVVGGTTMPILRVVERPEPGPRRLWAGAHVNGRGVLECSCGQSGLVWEWTSRLLHVPLSELDELASETPPGGLVLHLGTTPQDFSDLPLIRSGGGVWPLPLDFSGVDRAWFARAAIEAAAYAVAEAMSWLEEAAHASGPVRVCGGMTRSRLWLRSLAGLLKEPIEVGAEDATSIGAAGVPAAAPEAVIEPESELVSALGDSFARWRELVDHLDAGAVRISAMTGASR